MSSVASAENRPTGGALLKGTERGVGTTADEIDRGLVESYRTRMY